VSLTAKTGNLTLTGAVKGGTVDLVSTAGETAQTAASAVTANLLNVTTKTGYNLISAKNKIKKLGTHTRKSGPATIKGVGA
jgi:hypothetical protein